MNSKQVIKQLEADGWTLRGVRGSHHVFTHPNKPGHICVPHPKQDLGVVEVPVERYFGPAEELNITLPRLLLAKIDEYARAHGETRSGFLVNAARMAMR